MRHALQHRARTHYPRRRDHRLGDRRPRWRCGKVGIAPDHAHLQNEEAGNRTGTEDALEADRETGSGPGALLRIAGVDDYPSAEVFCCVFVPAGAWRPIFSACFTSSARDSAAIFRITWARWSLTVLSLIAIS